MTQVKLDVIQDHFGAQLNDLFGIFFEDLNHAADGGLYAEMVQNRSFEFEPVDHEGYHETYAWTINHSNQAVISTDQPLNSNNLHYLAVDSGEDGITMTNHGFNQGMFVQKDHTYLFSMFASAREKSVVQVFLENSQHQQLSPTAVIAVNVPGWKRYQTTIKASQGNAEGRLVVKVLPDSHINLDMISLFPTDTFHHRENGVRRDLGEALAAMHPKFMRFPGGCLVHDGTLDPDDRGSMYRWKNTIGPIEKRPTRRNKWDYNQTLGLGYYEYFQLAEDIGAKPLPVLPGGYDPHHNRKVPIDQLQPWIDDALDLIEFANGDTDTKWGKKRAEFGHPQPFGMEYLAIGNEEVGQAFFDRYPYFHKAIRERYPNIKLINTSGPFSSGGEFDRGWRSARENGSDFVDEHYYASPEWFLANVNRYDSYPTTGPKAFVGEYATKGNNWYNALTEACYMTGLERNADKVGLACYAPLFCNIGYPDWKPDLIYFNQTSVCKSVNYDVQKMFMKYQGTDNVYFKVKGMAAPDVKDPAVINGGFGFSSDHSVVQLSNIRLTELDTGVVKKFKNITIDNEESQKLGKTSSSHYEIDFNAVKVGGNPTKGFKLNFGESDSSKSSYSWLMGGTDNGDSMIYNNNAHGGSVWDQHAWHLPNKEACHFKIKVNRRHVKTWINQVEFNRIEILPTKISPLYLNVTYDRSSHQYYLKVINITDDTQQLSIPSAIFKDGTLLSLIGKRLSHNEIDKASVITIDKKKVLKKQIEVAPYSANVLVSRYMDVDLKK
ncbi:alpha-L-arabinofuranosidase C-terminal domain-containing protein [Lentilactobacillus hilgardii]|uniref:alpha-L-arabinofuranosidase C-terminal domain-containing protein n=1 Tax=Lentilactobacillus hilgardii TaxID=1588 RepID=UPI0021A6CB9D|nr:alpha-L-arabinofuranosidase C-terminal domain-containing protein [Lentilactobacillus hilgardii]